MPERLNIVAFLRVENEQALRPSLVRVVRSSLPSWVARPVTIWLGRDDSALGPWTSEEELGDICLSGSELLSIYFEVSGEPKKYAVLTIATQDQSAVYNLSLPVPLKTCGVEPAIELMSMLHGRLRDLCRAHVVVAGDELEVSNDPAGRRKKCFDRPGILDRSLSSSAATSAMLPRLPASSRSE
jgi:hypothetical protein